MAEVSFPVAFVFPNQFSIIIYFFMLRIPGVNPLNPPPPGPVYIVLYPESIQPTIQANYITFIDQVVSTVGAF